MFMAPSHKFDLKNAVSHATSNSKKRILRLRDGEKNFSDVTQSQDRVVIFFYSTLIFIHFVQKLLKCSNFLFIVFVGLFLNHTQIFNKILANCFKVLRYFFRFFNFFIYCFALSFFFVVFKTWNDWFQEWDKSVYFFRNKTSFSR